MVDARRGAVTRSTVRRRRGCAILIVVLVAWLAVGIVRAPAIGRDYFVSVNAGTTVTDVSVNGSIPLIPPLWGVKVDGTVHETNGNSYPAHLLLCIEPITALVIRCGSG